MNCEMNGEEAMEPTVDVFWIQEGRDPNPSGKPYLTVPVAESVAALGLSTAGTSSFGDAAAFRGT
jgi:hypothetical protein